MSDGLSAKGYLKPADSARSGSPADGRIAELVNAAHKVRQDCVLVIRGAIYKLMSQERYAGVVARCDELLRVDHRDACAHSYKIRALQALGRDDEALKCCNEWLEMHPDSAWGGIYKTRLLGQQGRRDEAVQALLEPEASKLSHHGRLDWMDQIRQLAEEVAKMQGDYGKKAEQRRLDLTRKHRNLLDERDNGGRADSLTFKLVTKLWGSLVAGSSVVGCQGTLIGMCQECGLFDHGEHPPCPIWESEIQGLEPDDYTLKCCKCGRPDSHCVDWDGKYFCCGCYGHFHPEDEAFKRSGLYL